MHDDGVRNVIAAMIKRAIDDYRFGKFDKDFKEERKDLQKLFVSGAITEDYLVAQRVFQQHEDFESARDFLFDPYRLEKLLDNTKLDVEFFRRKANERT